MMETDHPDREPCAEGGDDIPRLLPKGVEPLLREISREGYLRYVLDGRRMTQADLYRLVWAEWQARQRRAEATWYLAYSGRPTTSPALDMQTYLCYEARLDEAIALREAADAFLRIWTERIDRGEIP